MDMDGKMSNFKELSALQAKLHNAQKLLSDVYHYACEEGNSEIESLMSCADDCIIDAMECLNQLEAQAIDDASWRP